MTSANIILAGIPRSGTTLVCSLLNQLENCLALVEPMDMPAFLAQQHETGRAEYLTHYFQQLRTDVHSGAGVEMLDMAGNTDTATNTFSDTQGEKRKTVIAGKTKAVIEKPLDEGFDLLIKHPNAFSALLPELVKHWRCYAIIRNPLSVIASWHSLDHPLSKGHAPMAEAFDANLCASLNAESDPLMRQIILIGWYCQQFSRYLSLDSIIRYEDVVASGGRVLAVISPAATRLSQPLNSRNKSNLYSQQYLLRAAESLQADKGAWRQFYSNADISAVVEG